MKPHPNHQYYSAPPPHVTLLWTNGYHLLPSLNDPHISGEDIIYTIIPALYPQMEGVMCIVVLALSHLIPHFHKYTDSERLKIPKTEYLLTD